MTKFEDQSKYYKSYLNIGIVWGTIVLIMLLLTSCYVYESSYSPQQHNCELMARGDVCLSDHRCCNKQEHPTQIYYYNNLPYLGFYNDYYYYYGVAHIYPWWYYYTIRPHYTYSVNTHVYVTCNTGYYIGKPRGLRYNNNKGGTFRPTNTVVKTNRNNIRTNTNRNNIKTNINKTNNKTNIRTNTNKNRTNINKNRTNINRNNKVNINRNNSKRTNKSNVRKPR